MSIALRQAWRSLLARPTFTLGVLATLALGVGANAAMLGALDALLFRAPVGVADAGRVNRVYVGAPGPSGGSTPVVSYPFFSALRGRPDAFAGVAAVTDYEVPVGAGAAAERVPGRAVSANYFAVLGARPALGAFFTPADDRSGAAPAVVLGYHYWQRAFGGDRAVLGRTLTFGSRRARVIGVAPPDFSGLDFARVDVWLPVAAVLDDFGGEDSRTNNGRYFLQLVVRRRADVGDPRASAAAAAVYRAAAAAGGYPDAREAAATRVLLGPVQAARGPDAGDTRRLPLWLALMSAALLAAAGANATGLLLARALERRRLVAVQRALGARARDLARGAAAEAAVLAGGGAAVAAALAAALGVAVRRWVLGDAFAALPVLDARLLLLVAALALVVCLAAALVAAGVAARGVGGTAVLRAAESRGATRAGGRTFAGLVAGQVALTFVLLLGAGLFAGSLRRALAARIGYDPERVLLVSGDFAPSLDAARQAAAYREAGARLAALPGVAGVARSFMTPLRGVNDVPLRVPGLDSIPAQPGGGPYVSHVSPNFFAVAGTRLLAGRAPAAPATSLADTAGHINRDIREIAVSATTARVLWPDGGAVGRCVYVGRAPGCATVVGVVEDARRFALVEERALQVYVPLDFTYRPFGTLLVRTRGPADAAAAAVRRALGTLGPAVASADVRSVASVFAPNYRPYRAGAALLGAFGALALGLAAAGLFGAVGYALARRTREVGIRLALGAPTRAVVWLFATGGLAPAAAGLAVGALAFVAAQRTLAALLYGTSAHDWTAVGAAGAVLAAAAGLASWLPARRAARVDPAAALRAE